MEDDNQLYVVDNNKTILDQALNTQIRDEQAIKELKYIQLYYDIIQQVVNAEEMMIIKQDCDLID